MWLSSFLDVFHDQGALPLGTPPKPFLKERFWIPKNFSKKEMMVYPRFLKVARKLISKCFLDRVWQRPTFHNSYARSSARN
jgi:hypothetical protein